MRTPEETARLANGVTVPVAQLGGDCRLGTGWNLTNDRLLLYVTGPQGWTLGDAAREEDDMAQLTVALAADLAEARAEVAALREVAALVREWQAAKRASTITDGSGQSWDDLRIANDEREAIEARLLAATLPEGGGDVGSGGAFALTQLRECRERCDNLAATVAARDERVRELEAELAAMRPKVEAAERYAATWQHRTDEVAAERKFHAAHVAILAARPEKGGAG